MVDLIRFDALMPGVSCVGDGAPVMGRARNVRGEAFQRFDALLSWLHDAEGAGRVGIYLDGQLREVVPLEGERAQVAAMGAGDNSVLMVEARVDETFPAVMVDVYGQNAIVGWSHPADADVVGYDVYCDGVLSGSLRGMVLERFVERTPNVGTPRSGRLTVWGVVPEGMGRTVLQVQADNTGTGRWRFGTSGAWTEFAWARGGAVVVQDSVYLVFPDEAASYGALAEWEVQVAPGNVFVSGVLTPGEHVFTVRALDAAGNESVVSEGFGVYILDVPDALMDVAQVVEEGELTVSYTLPAGADGVNVYTNYDAHTETFGEYVVTNGLPFATIAAPVAEWVFTPAVEGRLLFVLRPYNELCEREGGELYVQSFPPSLEDSGVVLGEPARLRGMAMPGGKWRVEWDYFVDAGDACTGFLVYALTPDGVIDYDADLVATVDVATGAGRPVKRFGYTYDTGIGNSTVRVAVRASAGGGLVSGNVDYVVITTDEDAPGAPEDLYGGPA